MGQEGKNLSTCALLPSYHLFNYTPARNQSLCCVLQRAKLSRAYYTIKSEEESVEAPGAMSMLGQRKPGHPRNVGDKYLGCCSGHSVVPAQNQGLLLVWVGLAAHLVLRVGMAEDWPIKCSYYPDVIDR